MARWGAGARPRRGPIGTMEPSIFRFILRFSKWQQVYILLFTALSLPFYYASLDVPKLIVNQALSTEGGFPKPFTIFGFAFVELDQISLLYAFCAFFLVLMLINGGFKYYINVYKGILGERMLRRLRYQLLTRVLRFPLGHYRRVSSGEIIPMITSEVEPLGGYIGDALALPLYQGGLLITAIFFIFAQDLFMGLAAISLYPVQGWLIPKLQRKVNLLGKDRVKEVRKLSERIAEAVQISPDVYANDTMRYELADFSWRFGRIYDIRQRIYILKFLAKFLNNFLSQLTPFLFFSIGGYFVIKGDLSLGSLVAVLAAYKDLPGPWNELLSYYQTKEDSRIKYEQVVSQFDPPGLRDEGMLKEAEPQPLQGELATVGLTLRDDGDAVLDGITLKATLGRRIAVVGDGSSGKAEFAMLLARLLDPTSGRIMVGDRDMKELPLAVTGHRMGYVGAHTTLLSASLGDNLTYGLKHRPLKPVDYAAVAAARRKKQAFEAEITGNATDDRFADWIDYEAAGAPGPEALAQRIIHALDIADLGGEVYGMGLRGTIDPLAKPQEAERILEARRALRDLLTQADLADLVEQFDPERYNSNATVAENLLFGTPQSAEFDPERLAENPYLRAVLDQQGLTEDLLKLGYEVAQTMVELFAGLPPEHEYFAQFSFISFDDLPDFQNILRKAEGGRLDQLGAADRQRLLSLPFKLIPARHRVGNIDEALRERLLAARRAFAEGLPERYRQSIEFFAPDRYNALATIQDNILFGKVAYGKAHAAARVGELISEVVEALHLRDIVIEAAFGYSVGVGGSRLTTAQRQKVAIARAVLKRPDVLILNECTASLDGAVQAVVTAGLLHEFQGRTLIWVLHRPSLARHFDEVVVLRGGKVAAQGPFDEIGGPDTPLAKLVGAE